MFRYERAAHLGYYGFAGATLEDPRPAVVLVLLVVDPRRKFFLEITLELRRRATRKRESFFVSAK